MDKNAIKKYAVWARRELISRVSQKALQYGISSEKIEDAADSINGKLLTDAEKKQRAALVKRISEDGFEQIMEEVAYTWFNRFCALRFMEVNGYLPTHVRVFSDEENKFKPQILTEAINLDLGGLNIDKVYQLKNDNKTEELFKYLIITQCNALNGVLPLMFQQISDYTELLFPDNLLREGSVIEQLVSQIPAVDFDVQSDSGQIEIIGWLYQYYISEKHEDVVDPLHGKVVKKEEVPAATQLFTTDWVVRYLIDNSVGRYWIERHPESKLKDELQYFVMPKSGTMKYVEEEIEPKDLTVLDPCIGSGHFLIYAFDVLIKIYTEYGYSARDAASIIVENNLFGLDIDDRAAQLAYFSVMMKARQYDRRFLERGIKPQIYSIQESNNLSADTFEYIVGKSSALRAELQKVLDVFHDAKEYGSILQMPDIDIKALYSRFDEIIDDISLFQKDAIANFLPLCRIAEILTRKYAVVATNPPYLNKYDAKLKGFVEANYKDYSGDLFSVFMYRNLCLCKKDGYAAFMTPFVWMFIKTYEKIRQHIIKAKSIITLIQMEYSAYDEATVPICTFILKNGNETNKGLYFRLSDFKGGMEIQRQKVLEAISAEKSGYFYESSGINFPKIPGCPIAYWVSEKLISAFNAQSISENATPKQGMSTCDVNRFVHYWFEQDLQSTNIANPSSHKGWIMYNKGGEFRRWYGNREYVVYWGNNGDALRRNNAALRNMDSYFDEFIAWSKLSSSGTGFRDFENNFLFDGAGGSLFIAEKKNKKYYLGFLNSIVAKEILKIISPTINYNESHIGELPIILLPGKKKEIDYLVGANITISQNEWDSFEISWDFKKHPLI